MAELTPEEQKLKDTAAKVQAFFASMTRGLKVEDINILTTAFLDMGEGLDPVTKQIVNVKDALEDISKKALGVKSRDEIKKARDAIIALEKKMGENISAIGRANLNRMKFELELEAVKNAKVTAQHKDFMGVIGANMKGQQLKILQGMQSMFGMQIASKLMGFAGPLGIGIAAVAAGIAALQWVINQSKVSVDAFKGSWSSAGAMGARTATEYIGMTAKISQGFSAITEVGYTTKSAVDLVQKSMSSMSWTLGWTAIQSEGFTGSLANGTILASQRTRELVLDMGRMSTVMFGNTEEVKRFVALSQVYNVTTREGIRVLSTGIGQMASRLHLDVGTLMDTMTNMGATLLGTGAGMNDVAKTFIPFINNIKEFAKAEELSAYETNMMLKGVESLSKGVDTFLYMAAAGKTNLETDYETAIGVDALTRAKTVIDRYSKEGMSDVHIAMATQKMFGDVSEGIRLKLVRSFKKIGSMDELKGETKEEKMRELLGVEEGDETMWSDIAAGQMAGHNVSEQILGNVTKILSIATTGFVGLLRNGQKDQAASEISRMTAETSKTVRSGKNTYDFSGMLKG